MFETYIELSNNNIYFKALSRNSEIKEKNRQTFLIFSRKEKKRKERKEKKKEKCHSGTINAMNASIQL